MTTHPGAATAGVGEAAKCEGVRLPRRACPFLRGKLPVWSAGCSAIVTSRTHGSLASLGCQRLSPALHWDRPACGAEPCDQKIEEHTNLRQASGEIESGYGQRLCVMGVRQQWYQQPAADRLANRNAASPLSVVTRGATST